MNAPASITVTPVFVADLHVEGERMPIYVHVIDHPDGRVLVDTGMTELHPALADMDPRLRPLNEQDFDLAGIDIVVNTHLHGDHCGGNHLSPASRSTSSVRSSRTRAARTTTPSASGSRRPACGTCPSTASSGTGSGSFQRRATRAARRWSSSRPASDRSSSAATSRSGSASSRKPDTEGQLLVLGLDRLVWLAHGHEPWRPRTDQGITLALSSGGSSCRRRNAGLHLDYVLLGSRPFGLFESLCTLPNFVCRSRYAATPPRTPTSTAPNWSARPSADRLRADEGHGLRRVL